MRISLLGRAAANARLLRVSLGKKQLATPTYFPAVSKKEIRDPDDKFVELVVGSRYPRLLVSAYDYGSMGTSTQRRMIGRLSDYYRHGSVTILDSGVFEAYWRDDPRWTFGRYRASVKNVDSDLFFSYDVLPKREEKGKHFQRSTMQSVVSSAQLGLHSQCIPIIHGKNASQLAEIASAVARKSGDKSPSIAVSEKELGHSLSEKGITVMKLRRILGGQDGGLLHVLGCGDPISMACYVYCGADTFDSLDWALFAFDPVDEALIDISHLELLECKCSVCRNPRIDSDSKVFLHNLLSYQNFSLKLQSMIKQGTLKDYLLARTGKRLLGRLNLKR